MKSALDVLGLAATSGIAIAAINDIGLRVIQQPVADTGVAAIQLTGAIGALVASLGFGHRLLMRAKDETLAETKAGYALSLGVKDELIKMLIDDKARLEIETVELRNLLLQGGQTQQKTLDVARHAGSGERTGG